MIYKKVVRNDLFIRSFRRPNMYFSDKSGLHSQFLKMLQNHKGAVKGLVIHDSDLQIPPKSASGSQEDQSCDERAGTFGPTPSPGEVRGTAGWISE